MKQWLILLMAILLLCCGCSETKPAKEAVTDPASTQFTLPQMDLEGPFIDELVTVTYKDIELVEIAEFEGTNAELFEKFPIECQRDTAHGYRAMYLGENEAAMVVVEEPLGTRYGYTMLPSQKKADFETLTIGDPLSAVQALDKNGNYAFGSASWDIAENLSWHATTDHYLVFIRYTADFTIASIQFELL